MGRRQEIIEEMKAEGSVVQTGGLAQINLHDSIGIEPLMCAAMHRQYEMARELIQAKANVDGVDFQRNSALMHATRLGFAPIVADLLEGNAKTTLLNKKEESASDLARNNIIKEMIMKAAVKKCIKHTPVKPPPAEKTKPIFRCRVEGLPPNMLPDMIEDEIFALMRKLHLVPKKVDVPAELFTQRPYGHACIDFGKK